MASLELDVMDTNSIQRLAAEVQERFPALNVLINNAGISKPESYAAEAVDISTALAILQTNITSVIQLTAALLPHLKMQPQATLMATTSGLAFVPMAGYPNVLRLQGLSPLLAGRAPLSASRHQCRGT